MMKEKILTEFEETAMMGAKRVREYLVYQGANKEYLNKAKVGVVSMGVYAKVRATMANEESNRLVAERTVKQITA